MNSRTNVVPYLPSHEAVRGWAAPFEHTGINDIHLFHIVAGQAAAYAAMKVASTGGGDVCYRPSVEQVSEWVSPFKSGLLSKDQILQYVADRATCWVTSQV